MGIPRSVIDQTIERLVKEYGSGYRQRIHTGVHQAARRWQKTDGSPEDFQEFCRKHFFADAAQRRTVFQRFLDKLESLYGNLHRIYREFHRELHVDSGRMSPVDLLFAQYNPFAHVQEDMFRTRLAFVVLLNFPIYSLAEKDRLGRTWERRQWAEARLADMLVHRIPAPVQQQRSAAYARADEYISHYNIFMDKLRIHGKTGWFPPGVHLISHWGLRDEIKALYPDPNGLTKQRMIYTIMNRILRQEIPAVVINNPDVEWDPDSNRVYRNGCPVSDPTLPEADRRYQHLKSIFEAERQVDAYTPDTPSLIDRRFLLDREMEEAQVEALIIDVLRAPVLKALARLIQNRLGRALEPFDIWYTGLRPQAHLPEAELDKRVQKTFPTLTAFQEKLPWILQRLGFSAARAAELSHRIVVEPARGAGHALGSQMRGDSAHLRTRIPEQGMNYKGFNTAMHELGHTVEQVFSLEYVDYYTLHGVPNTGFTEAFAFLFQSRDLHILGLDAEDAARLDWLYAHEMWSAFEIAGVALVDMRIWRWMYQHPDASADDLKRATLEIARDVWNQYFAPVLGMKNQEILAIYSHIIDAGMYIPDYLLGHLIAFQIFSYMQDKDLASEMERMCKLGRLTPRVWMQHALGEDISARPMIEAATRAIKNLKRRH